MGFFDYLSDLYDSLSIQTAEAEEQQKEDSKEEGGDEEKSEDSGEGEGEGESEGGEKKEGDSEGEGESEEGGEEEGGEEGGEEEEEEEEEEEPEDIKPTLEDQCLKSAQCAPLKHHYDECAERVQQQQEEHGHPKEDCVEEFFHMMHCATQCAAPKLFRQLR